MLTFLLLSVVAQAPLPELKIEATDGGSALVIRNNHASQALTAYLIELVDYPGTSWAFSQDELASGSEPLAAGKLRRIPISNMTVGAAPDYVKMRAALFADGSASGDAEQVAQLRARRALLLSTIREILAGNLEAAKIPVSNSKLKRSDPTVVDNAARRAIGEEAMALKSAGTLIEKFKARETALSQ